MPMLSLIAVQDRYIATVNAGIERWKHRKDGGHIDRIKRGARRKATRELARLGFGMELIPVLIDEARQVAELQRNAEDE